MLRLLIPQTIQLVVAIWGISLTVFLVNFVIGDPLTGLISPETPEETRAILRHQYGFDRPVMVQYFDFARRAAVGNFGDSYIIKKPAIDLVFERVPATLAARAGRDGDRHPDRHPGRDHLGVPAVLAARQRRNHHRSGRPGDADLLARA